MWILTEVKEELRISTQLFQVTTSKVNSIRHKLEFVDGSSNQKKMGN